MIGLIPLYQWFSNVEVYPNQLELLLTQRWLDPTTRISDSIAQRTCISNKFPGAADAAVPRRTLRNAALD